MTTAILLALLSLGAPPQAPGGGSIRVVVHDPSGAVIPAARVSVTRTDGQTAVANASSDAQGVATLKDLPPGHYTVTISFPGFETRTVADLRVRTGEIKRDVTLAIEKVSQNVSVGRDPALAASDPRSERFGNVLTRDQIDSLPDDPDEMEQTLKDMAGPGATIRMDGFRGGKLPPKSQIRSIRFSSGTLSAENHSGGITFVDIATQPGQGPIRGGADATFRDGGLDARNAFQPSRGPEQSQQYNMNMSGSLRKDKMSFSAAAGGASLFDSANIFAAGPGGDTAAAVKRPSDRSNVSLRIDDALSKSHTMHASYQQNDSDQHELGVGGFNLADRAYSRSNSDRLVRVSESGPWARLWYAESRLQLHWSSTDAQSVLQAPAVQVLDAFTSGGAEQAGGRSAAELEYATNVDYARKNHAIRLGTLIEGGRYRSDSQTNYLGTFTFASLTDYEANRPATFSQRLGNPLVNYSQWQAGFFVQDDWRVRKNLTLSGGLREELQTHLGGGWHLGPRGSMTWSPFKNGKTTIRAAAGLFYDWLDADTYEQTLRVDGVHEQDAIVINPGYPDPMSGAMGEVALPPSRYQLSRSAVMPKRAIVNAGLTQQLAGIVNLNFNYTHTEGWDRLLGLDVNAPVDGVRPDPALGTVTEVESIGRMRGDSFTAGFNISLPKKRTFLFANYALLRQYNDGDGPFSLPANSYDLAAEWGRAAGVPHQIVSAVLNTAIGKSLRVAISTTAHAGTPYNLTTGHDDNGDTIFTDRPAGVARNSATTAGMWDAAARLGYTFGFGTNSPGGGAGGPVVVVQRLGGGAGDLLSGLGSLGAPNDDKRLHLELFVAASNVFNRVNLMGYSGVMTSPFFGQPTAAGPGRKVDAGIRVTF